LTGATTGAAATRPGVKEVSVLIIGAGFGGLLAGIKLREAGEEEFVILEKDDGVGGTWWANSYPGCACDVQSHLYSYSFEPNPDWNYMFGRQEEIRDYLERCAERYALSGHIRLSAKVESARWQGKDGRWLVTTSRGETYSAKVLIAAIGGLSRPLYPDIPGIERFQGMTCHSASWDHEFSLENKRVAIIGTGASAIQIVPAVAPEAETLFLFQRTPPWILPRPDRKVSRLEKWLFRTLPLTQKIMRCLLYWRLEGRATAFVVFPRLTRLVEWLGRWNIRRGITDPGLRLKVVPDFPAGCKRVLLSDDYYPTLTRENVKLVTRNIREINETGIVTTDGLETPVDAIVFCTGFRATQPVPQGRFVGREGLDLTQRWGNGMEAFMGMNVSGFPNMFILNGPNTGLGHNSVVFMLEAQIHYVMEGLRQMREEGIAAMEIRRDVEAAFNRRLQQRLSRTVWASGCRSWYIDERGRNTTLWPGFTVEYWARTRRFRLEDYVIEAGGEGGTPGAR
jgi:cation diffusion facilitator CzcD-associated flavoprotein CzcO